jgi:hypothetical protein
MGGVEAGCLAMMITISTSGGIGGFGLARTAEVSVDALPDSLREEACLRLAPEALGSLEAMPTRGADRIVYHIVVQEGADAGRSFDLPESALPEATLDLIDELLHRGRG